MPSNRLVWQDKPGVPSAIRESQYPSEVDEREIVVKAHVWAANPAEVIIQDQALSFITYPVTLGTDIAGTVETVGKLAAAKFKVGDRIIGAAMGATSGKPERGGFQEYVVLDHALACKIPDSMSFREGVVFPLCISSASFGLFSKQYLGLPFPSTTPTSNGKSFLVWGGSSAIGSNSIQLASAAGFKVITTCSPRNFEYVKSLGAYKAFDYSSPTVVEDVVVELDAGVCAGIHNAVGPVGPACQVSLKSKQKLFVSSATLVSEKDTPEGVEAKFVFGTGGVEMFEEILPATFGGFLPEALASGQYKVAPEPQAVPTKGLEGVQEAIDTLRKGVSAKKIVIEAE